MISPVTSPGMWEWNIFKKTIIIDVAPLTPLYFMSLFFFWMTCGDVT